MNKYMSVTKLKLFETCQRCFHLRYNEGMKQPYKEYFEIGKKTEELLYCLLETGKLNIKHDEYPYQLAQAIYENEEFQNLIKDQPLTYSKKYEQQIDGIPIIAYTDLEIPNITIDIKTSKNRWKNSHIQDNKYQAIEYNMLNDKDFYFVVSPKVSSPTPQHVQVIRINVSEEVKQDFITKLRHAWDVWTMGLLGKDHTGGYRCLFPNS